MLVCIVWLVYHNLDIFNVHSILNNSNKREKKSCQMSIHSVHRFCVPIKKIRFRLKELILSVTG